MGGRPGGASGQAPGGRAAFAAFFDFTLEQAVAGGEAEPTHPRRAAPPIGLPQPTRAAPWSTST